MTDAKTTRLTLVGAAGRMGAEIVRAVQGDPRVCLAAALEHAGAAALGRDAGESAGIAPLGVAIASDFERAVASCDVVVDFSRPEATAAALAAARRGGRPFLTGTTGLDARMMADLDAAACEIPVLESSNFSLGVAVMHRLLEQAVSALGADFDLEIVEMHHRDKVDAPSGTALALAKTAARGQEGATLAFGRQGRAGARPYREIGIHALRGGWVLGEHRAIFAGRHETLEITHRAASRTLFAAGAIQAAVFLCSRPPGRYSVADVIAAAML